MAVSNYEIMRDQMRGEFVKYDQEAMIRKFHLEYDEAYLYIEFVRRNYRIGRKNGRVEWSEDGFRSVTEGDYNESMTIYDMLCCSGENCHLSGSFCPADMLKGTVHSSGPGKNLFQKAAEEFSGNLEGLRYACEALGNLTEMSGDVAAVLYPFPFLPVILQYWEADEEFPANLKFMFDENILSFLHFETLFFMMGHILSRIKEIMQKEEKRQEREGSGFNL